MQCDTKVQSYLIPANHFPFTFPTEPTIYKKIIMEYKRQYRDLPDEVKQKISASMKGRAKSYDHFNIEERSPWPEEAFFFSIW